MISILIALILLGLLLYIVNLLPIDPTIKKVIVAVAVVLVAIWVIQLLFGGFALFPAGGPPLFRR